METEEKRTREVILAEAQELAEGVQEIIKGKLEMEKTMAEKSPDDEDFVSAMQNYTGILSELGDRIRKFEANKAELHETE